MSNFNASVEVLKVDDTDGIIYGYAIVSKEDDMDYYDLQGDHIPERVMAKAATEFMANGEREAREMHMGICKGQIVHSLPLTTELSDLLGIEEITKTGWIIGMKPSDKEIVKKFASGELTGFSIGGSGEYE